MSGEIRANGLGKRYKRYAAPRYRALEWLTFGGVTAHEDMLGRVFKAAYERGTEQEIAFSVEAVGFHRVGQRRVFAQMMTKGDRHIAALAVAP